MASRFLNVNISIARDKTGLRFVKKLDRAAKANNKSRSRFVIDVLTPIVTGAK